MMNEISKNTFNIWRFWKKSFHVCVLQNNSYLDRLKNIIKYQIFQSKWKFETCVWVEVRARTYPRLIKSKIDVSKHIVIPWTIVYEPSGGPKGARSATIFSSRCFKSICFSIYEILHYVSVPSACFFESKGFTDSGHYLFW